MEDDLISSIANYVKNPPIFSESTYRNACYCLVDALGCAFLALNHPACTKLLGPIVPGMTMEKGCRVPGTNFVLDPVSASFNLGTMIRWLDYNDTWLALEWGHPSDNIGGLLSVCEYISNKNCSEDKPPLKIKTLLHSMILAYEIQGVLCLSKSLNREGFDHVHYVKVATAAVAAELLGGNIGQIKDVISQAFLDGCPLRTYRHAPNVGSRKSWAAGDATSRGVWLALLTMKGEKGYDTPITTPRWGFNDVILKGKDLRLSRPLGSYVIDNILFKISFPAEFHAQSAVEAAIRLHPQVKGRLNEIEKIVIQTHESAIRIIDKKGKLNNPADRDHCLQYMTAVGLYKGHLCDEDYEDETGENPQIDELRSKMHVIENKSFSEGYLDPEKRSIANSVKIHFKDGSFTDEILVEYPIGHPKRRKESLPLLVDKFRANAVNCLSSSHIDKIIGMLEDTSSIVNSPIQDLFVESSSL